VGRPSSSRKQSIRHFGVKVKLNAVRSVVGGKRVVLATDSIVRADLQKDREDAEAAGATEST